MSADGELKKIRVLIVDDHPIMRVGVAAILSAQPDLQVVAQAGTAAEAVRLFAAERPDLTLMDLRLPDKSGVEAIRAIRAISPKARIVALTTYEGDEDIHQALEAGAQGYLIKGMPHDALVKALYRVHAGHRFLPQVVSQALSSRVPGSHLSQREQEVLQLLFAGKSNREIAEELAIKEATVKSHVSVILMRLNVSDRTQAVVEGLKRGLVHL
ncbi:response regulator [Granulicella mallensis]|jgi:DNA-binding NarL/FixJ family response regulator|uniref:Two component transcriptional regulator, LuxR family n=1 Tax=Granulicella mallensis (strain ATCC BAA-1857 / DSM 23137 / MP5ACTX8) TaxID=682795 RepID=G8NXA4_GRAMM|nr:response regulator transcription factor [Granulicella mallensis]AEU37811.1 two component transcriptional regulator, LuxR family [Granulicella mallensis MP5ACTX8]